ncbi:hypothetical protein [Erythrobacter sp. THAF29]|uniref:hypothetical protein n=1 Tax=Erythrobacter sp. THAF29 TaxID=2587851 RepID=UPI00351BD586
MCSGAAFSRATFCSAALCGATFSSAAFCGATFSGAAFGSTTGSGAIGDCGGVGFGCSIVSRSRACSGGNSETASNGEHRSKVRLFH